MEYLLVEELDSASAEVILPYAYVYSNDNTNSSSLPESTSKSAAPSIYLNATSLSDHTDANENNIQQYNENTPTMVTNEIEQSSPPPSRVCTPDLPIKIIRSNRETGVSCDYCHKSFPSRSKMICHRRMHEPDRPRFDCPFEGCDRTYLSRQSCELHYKQTHCSRDDYQPFKCELCNKAFAIPQTLEVHMRYHTREFPYECQHCHRRFGQKGHLTSHMQVKHNNLRYNCPEEGCGKVFKNTISLRNHSFSHTGMPFRCAYCDRGYPQKSRLKVHLKLKHEVDMPVEELESMRKLKNIRTRTRHTFVKLQTSSEVMSQVKAEDLDEVCVSDAYFENVGQ